MNTFAKSVLNAELGKTYLFAVGQAGYIIKSKSGKLLGIDLYLSDCVERVEGHDGFKRILPKILSPQDLMFDVLIATHPHYDHFDMDSIPALMMNNVTKLFASVNCKKEVQKLSMDEKNVVYVKVGDSFSLEDFKLEFVRCDHGEGAPDAVGVIVSVDEKKLYFAGDTCLRLDWFNYFNDKGPFDVMVAPINGAFGNLNEEECVELAMNLKPKIVIPSHYGMFKAHGGNVNKFIETIGNEIKYCIMEQGEKMII